MADGRSVTLYCFAHAGAGVSSFHRWPGAAGSGVEIVPLTLPGREGRWREERITGRAELVAEFLDILGRNGNDRGPFALYGHSLGGLVAYTLARTLADKGLEQPAFVALGATPPPDEPPALLDAADAPAGELLRLLGTLGPLPSASVTAPGGVWNRTVLPVLRDDLRLAAALREAAVDPATGGPLDVPLLALGGTADPAVRPGTLAGWHRWTTGPLTVRTVAGDHFFVRGPQAPRILGRACRVVRRLLPEAPTPAPTSVHTTVRNTR
ncbi:thioesterase II family protein [Streptomyces sp. NPDC053750]|uniref:thioesterase II family protein n=1 Tax=Streptomyces sp. NPDC053750 TaxID=3365714 RepID=UPI0037CF6395